MSKPIHISQYGPDDYIRKTVLTHLNKQPWYVEKKDFIAMVAGGIVTLAQLNLIPPTAPEWVHVAIGAITWVAALFVISGTPGAVTKSMEKRLAATAQELEGVQPVQAATLIDVPANPGSTDILAQERDRCAQETETSILGYGMECNHGGVAEVPEDEYVGEHRAD